jgi:hypothetical protein
MAASVSGNQHEAILQELIGVKPVFVPEHDPEKWRLSEKIMLGP